MNQEDSSEAQESRTVVLDGIGGYFAVPNNVLETYRVSGQLLETIQQRLSEFKADGEVSGHLLSQQPTTPGMPVAKVLPPFFCPPGLHPIFLFGVFVGCR